MFYKILSIVIKLCAMIIIFILAFCMSFYILLRENDAFSDFRFAFLKTILMFTGEMIWDRVGTSTFFSRISGKFQVSKSGMRPDIENGRIPGTALILYKNEEKQYYPICILKLWLEKPWQ